MNRTNKATTSKNTFRINSNIYSVVEAVNASIAPGEEELVPMIVKHIIETHNAGIRH